MAPDDPARRHSIGCLDGLRRDLGLERRGELGEPSTRDLRACLTGVGGLLGSHTATLGEPRQADEMPDGRLWTPDRRPMPVDD
jgi:hypothetical protein